MPQVGPQTEALESKADRLFYGGQAGGGKTDLLIGGALTLHERAIIFRRIHKELISIVDRTIEIIGHKDGYNSQDAIWRNPSQSCKVLEFGACQHLGDEGTYQGRPHDLKAFDEITRFLKPQFEYLCGWNRTKNPNQRSRVICAGNPPTEADGDWVVEYWGPWLDENNPEPAAFGELRWFAMLDGEDKMVDDGKSFEFKGETIEPHSRTFIPSSLDDNIYYRNSGYRATLQALPEPLRSKMLKGDFSAGREDDPYQVIPTDWVLAAQERWKVGKPRNARMTAVGVDPARGGLDETILSPRYDNWFAEQVVKKGEDTPDGPSVVGLVIATLRDAAQINLDSIGIGSSVFDHLRQSRARVKSLVSSEKSHERDRTNSLGFINLRAQLWWRMREALDPDYGDELALPPDRKLRADLCAPKWRVTARGIQVESKEDIFKRIGRSTDRGDAAVYSNVPARMGIAGPRHARESDWKLV